MRAATVALLALLCSTPAFAHEGSPLTWPVPDRKAADWISTGLVFGQIVAETIATWRRPNRLHGFGCQALRMGAVVGSAELTKLVVHRTRPDGSDRKSFFSEHTAVAAVNSGWSLAVSIPITIGTGYLRQTAAKHYLSDVAVGATVGLLARTICADQ